MPYVLTYEKGEGFLHAAASGDFVTLEELFQHLDEVITMAQENQFNRVLLDFRELRARIKDYHATFFTEGLLDRGYPGLAIRFAAVVHPDDLEKARAFEAAFHNRAILNKAFTELDAATRWLLF